MVVALSQDPSTLPQALHTFRALQVRAGAGEAWAGATPDAFLVVVVQSPSLEAVDVLVSALARSLQADPTASTASALWEVLTGLGAKAVAPSDTALLNVYRALPHTEGGMQGALDKLTQMVAAAATV